MRYTVIVSVCRALSDGWNSARQIPTFGLPDSGNSLATTAAIARSVVDPYELLTVYVAIWDNVDNVSHRAEFGPTPC